MDSLLNTDSKSYLNVSKWSILRGDFLPHFLDDKDENSNAKPFELNWTTIYSDATKQLNPENIEEIKKIKENIVERGEDINFDANNKESEKIGYVIELPNTKPITGFMIIVYGGVTDKDPPHPMANYQSTAKNFFEKYLLNEGIAMVRLNLADLTENGKIQYLMESDMFEKIQRQISKFKDVLTNKPESISSKLTTFLKGKTIGLDIPIYLYGASFGGLRVVRYAEKHHKTSPFNGYISHGGALCYDMMTMWNAGKESYGTNPQEIDRYNKDLQIRNYLDPYRNIKQLNAPLLILHNPNDNTVVSSAPTEFYKSLSEKQKELVTFYMPRVGNLYVVQGDTKEYIGHFAGYYQPSDSRHYGEQIIAFMARHANPKSELYQKFSPVLHQETQKWRTERYKQYSDVSNKLSPQLSYDKDDKALLDPTLSDIFLPFMRIEYEGVLKNRSRAPINENAKELIRKMTQEEKQDIGFKGNQTKDEQFEKDWNTTYLPLLLTLTEHIHVNSTKNNIVPWQKRQVALSQESEEVFKAIKSIVTKIQLNQVDLKECSNYIFNNLKCEMQNQSEKEGQIKAIFSQITSASISQPILTLLSRWIMQKSEYQKILNSNPAIKILKQRLKTEINTWQSNAQTVIQKVGDKIATKIKVINQFKNNIQKTEYAKQEAIKNVKEKIRTNGFDALTKEEREILFSENYDGMDD